MGAVDQFFLDFLQEPGISFYTHFKTTMKDKVARAVFLSELAALRKVSRRKIN